MATNMDKALYEAPQGLDQLGEAEEPIEIEIEDPEAVRIKAGDVEIEIEPEEGDDEFSKNLAEDIPDDVLATLASELIGDFESDVSARKDWVQTYDHRQRNPREKRRGGASSRRHELSAY